MLEDSISPLERQLYFKTAHAHFKAGCPALALEVLSKLPSKIMDPTIEQSNSKYIFTKLIYIIYCIGTYLKVDHHHCLSLPLYLIFYILFTYYISLSITPSLHLSIGV